MSKSVFTTVVFAVGAATAMSACVESTKAAPAPVIGDPNAICPDIFDPVCGADGERYGNACLAGEAGTTPRTGGALIELDAGGTYWFWSENAAFIAEAKAIVAGTSPQRVPVFNDLSAGPVCNEPHKFTVDPVDMNFADLTIELCDAAVGYIDENLDEWLAQVDQWCPWNGQIISVHEE